MDRITAVAPPREVCPIRRPSAAPSPRAIDWPVNVCAVDSAGTAACSAFVAAHPDGELYHTPQWRAAVDAAQVGPVRYLAALRDAQIVGVLALAETGPPDQRRLLSLPGTPAGGILAADPAAHAALLNRARHLADRHTSGRATQRRWNAESTAQAGAVRVAVAELLAHLGAADSATSTAAHSFGWRSPLTLLLEAPADEYGALDDPLSRLAGGPLQTDCLVPRDARGRIEGVGLWTRLGCRAYLLAHGGRDAAGTLTVLRGVARRAAKQGARTLDFSIPVDAPDRLGGVRQLRGCETPQECPLT